MLLAVPRSWMMALDFSLGAAGAAGLASMHEPVGSDRGPSACQRILAGFGTILEPYDPHRRWVRSHTSPCRDMLAAEAATPPCSSKQWLCEP